MLIKISPKYQFFGNFWANSYHTKLYNISKWSYGPNRSIDVPLDECDHSTMSCHLVWWALTTHPNHQKLLLCMKRNTWIAELAKWKNLSLTPKVNIFANFVAKRHLRASWVGSIYFRSQNIPRFIFFINAARLITLQLIAILC